MSDAERRDLTDVDLRLISILQSNGRKSNTQISKELGLTESTVRRRIDALIRDEYIQIVALTDPLKIGFSVWVLVQAQVELKYLDKVADELAKFPQISFVAVTSGSFEILFTALFRSTAEFYRFVANEIASVKGIKKTETSVVLRLAKRTYAYGVPIEVASDPGK